MADIRVDIPELKNFKGIVDRNSQEFDGIKQSLASHLAQLRANEWETEGAKDFDNVFKESEQDIDRLVNIMQDFVAYLNRKIQQAWEIDSHKASM